MSGFESLIPPIVAVGAALLSKRVNLALFLGIWIGGVIYVDGNVLRGLEVSFTWLVNTMTDEWNARFMLLIALLGSGAAFIYKIGGSDAVARAFANRIKTRQQAQLLTYALGLCVFFNDYVNTVVVGNAMRGIANKHRISSEKLSYLIDSTAAPVATIAPISDWVGYQVALIGTVFATLSITSSTPYSAFLSSVPWNFYCLLTLAMVPMLIHTKRDFGPMRTAEHRAMSTGLLVAENDTPLSDVDSDLGAPIEPQTATTWHFVVPLIALIAATFWGLWDSAGGGALLDIGGILEQADVSKALLWGAFAMTFAGIVLALGRGISLQDCEHIMLIGFRTMLPALLIMVLAWTIAATCEHLGTAQYIVSITEGWMTPTVLPILVFVVAGIISFTTGTSWGTMAILTPIALPIAFSLASIDASQLLVVHITIGAIFSGSVFGDHCSPISDTTVMSSIFSGADHIAHVRTQLPYAAVPAAISAFLFLFSAFVRSPWALLAAGLFLQYLAVRLLTANAEKN
ncbi:MAG TPA: Na+/H+ antiporter NhaC family protein [Woeseiaceae bacterium]|nr:Na+/H+ antiporter NhaC family protein [Woeseiaceae bacterium]